MYRERIEVWLFIWGGGLFHLLLHFLPFFLLLNAIQLLFNGALISPASFPQYISVLVKMCRRTKWSGTKGTVWEESRLLLIWAVPESEHSLVRALEKQTDDGVLLLQGEASVQMCQSVVTHGASSSPSMSTRRNTPSLRLDSHVTPAALNAAA